MNGDAAADPADRAHPDPLPDLPENQHAGYLDAAHDTLRASDPGFVIPDEPVVLG